MGKNYKWKTFLFSSYHHLFLWGDMKILWDVGNTWEFGKSGIERQYLRWKVKVGWEHEFLAVE